METPELSEEDQVLAGALQKRDRAFIWRLLLRMAVVGLFVAWVLLQGPGRAIGRWAADGFGVFSGS